MSKKKKNSSAFFTFSISFPGKTLPEEVFHASIFDFFLGDQVILWIDQGLSFLLEIEEIERDSVGPFWVTGIDYEKGYLLLSRDFEGDEEPFVVNPTEVIKFWYN